jgi:serine/threonine protein phosphatase PrpC
MCLQLRCIAVVATIIYVASSYPTTEVVVNNASKTSRNALRTPVSDLREWGLGVQMGVNCNSAADRINKKHGQKPDVVKNCGQAAFYVTSREEISDPKFISFGIADGVGGLTESTGHPTAAALSKALCAGARQSFMEAVEPHPWHMLKQGYENVLEGSDKNAGGSTAVILVFDRFTGRLQAAHVGDSGFLIIRNGNVFFRSTLFKPSLPRSSMEHNHVGYNDAVVTDHTVQPGDIVIVSSASLKDKVFEHGILSVLDIHLARFYKKHPIYSAALDAWWAGTGPPPTVEKSLVRELNKLVLDVATSLTKVAHHFGPNRTTRESMSDITQEAHRPVLMAFYVHVSSSSAVVPKARVNAQVGVSCKAKHHKRVRTVQVTDTSDSCGGNGFYVSTRERVLDSTFISFGVADGVHGEIDTGAEGANFSTALCAGAQQAFVRSDDPHPLDVLKQGYEHVVQGGDKNAGGSTALFMVLNRITGHLETANLGDSGYLIIRNGSVLYRSEAQMYRYNTPFQLTLSSKRHNNDAKRHKSMFGCDDAYVTSHTVRPGDVVIVGSSGLFENLFDEDIVSASEGFLGRFYKRHPAYHAALQQSWDRSTVVPMLGEDLLQDLHAVMADLSSYLTTMASNVTQNQENRHTPFSKYAHNVGEKWILEPCWLNCGKETDINVIVAYVHADRIDGGPGIPHHPITP